MPLERNDHQHLDAAQGYLALGMAEDANRELDGIDPFCCHLPEVLAVRLAVYEHSHRWGLAETVAKRLTATAPDDPLWPISLAYATRRLRSVAAARAILLEAAKTHPEEPTIQYNLGCYACQLGELENARAHLRRAFTSEPKYREIALDDPDLQPLWDLLTNNWLDP